MAACSFFVNNSCLHIQNTDSMHIERSEGSEILSRAQIVIVSAATIT